MIIKVESSKSKVQSLGSEVWTHNGIKYMIAPKITKPQTLNLEL
jgi:hypothetical protein